MDAIRQLYRSHSRRGLQRKLWLGGDHRPNGFFAGDDVLLGLLMLGPDRHYPDHYHPAPELYWPLTSESYWSRDGKPFAVKAQGEIIWHPSMALHATITNALPLLAVWCWTRDTATPARLKLS